MKSIEEIKIYLNGLGMTFTDKVWHVAVDSSQYATPDYTKIQDAIDAASEGDIILVYAGTYDENVVIDNPVYLFGNGALIEPVVGGRVGGETIISNQYAVDIKISNVVINGFEVTGFRYGIDIPSDAFSETNKYLIQNIFIEYNYIHADDAWVGVVAAPGTLRNLKIGHNIIYVNNVGEGGDPYALAAIDFSSGATAQATYENIEIYNNKIQNLSTQYGVFAGASPDAYLINGFYVRDNIFTSIESNFNVGNILDGEFSGNIVENNVATIGIHTGNIVGNTFKNGGYLALWGTEYNFIRPSQNVEIKDNVFTNEVHGNGIRFREGVIGDTITVKLNSFQNSGISPDQSGTVWKGYLINHQGTGTVDVTQNWWGNTEGPTGNSGAVYGLTVTEPFIREYDESGSGQGFWPKYVSGIEYIGKNCFGSSRGICLVAQVEFYGQTGEGIPVEFYVCDIEFKTKTLVGGVAVCPLGYLCKGEYIVEVRMGYYNDREKIRVGCRRC